MLTKAYFFNVSCGTLPSAKVEVDTSSELTRWHLTIPTFGHGLSLTGVETIPPGILKYAQLYSAEIEVMQLVGSPASVHVQRLTNWPV